MDETTIKIRNNLLEFTTDFCKIDGHEYRPKNVFVLSGENVISSLVLKLQKEELDEETIVQKCQRQLLWITAPEAMIRIRHTILWEKKPNKVKRLEKQYYDLPLHNGLLKLLAFFNSKNWRENNDPSEMRCESSLAIVFTYDHEVDFLNNQSTNFAVEWFRNFESERQLNKVYINSLTRILINFFSFAIVKTTLEIFVLQGLLEKCAKNMQKHLCSTKTSALYASLIDRKMNP